MATLAEHYHRLRAPRFSPYGDRRMFVQSTQSAIAGARHALLADQVRHRWQDADGYCAAMYETSETWEPGEPRVRIVEHPDATADLDNLLGDCFEPRHHPEIKPEILERERQAEIDRIERDGVWGYVAEYWDGDQWEHADSIWGFIGGDFDSSGYDTDLMESALDALDACLVAQARALEASRPDMYRATV